MSKISLKHSGGNVVSLNSPTSAPTSADVAFKLPNADGTSGQAIVTDASGNLSFASTGKILQIVSTTKTDTFSMNSGTYSDVTGLSVSITPSATSSKCLIIVDMMGVTSDSTQGFFQLFRTSDNSALALGDAAGSRTRASFGPTYFYDTNAAHQFGINFLDSPNTTSAFNYKVQCRNQGNSANVYVNRTHNDADSSTGGRYSSTITVMEVAA